jgi:hypothetical protein
MHKFHDSMSHIQMAQFAKQMLNIIENKWMQECRQQRQQRHQVIQICKQHDIMLPLGVHSEKFMSCACIAFN